MKEVKLSIIMPVYNTKKYLKRCLDSIISEIDNETELIIVDDHSTDGSLEYLSKYQNKHNHKNIIIIPNSKNIGAGLSRNKALKKAKGQYIGFIDSDDYVSKNYFHNMLNLIIKEDSDIVVSDITMVNDNGIVSNNNLFNGNVYNCKENNQINISKELVLGNWACASTCSKLFRKELIKNYEFSERQSDDILFTIPAIMNAKKISYCRHNPYFYYERTNSLTRTKEYKKYKESLECLFEATNYLYNIDINCAQIYSSHTLFPFLCYSVDDIKINYIDEYLNIIKTNLYEDDKITNLLINNSYFEKNHLFDSNLYHKYIKCIINKQYDKYKNIILSRYCPEPSINTKIFNYFHNMKMVSKKFNPLVSIIIPVYNGSNYIEEAIVSAINQTYQNIEIIVVDDGSTDNTEEIVKKYKKYVKYYKKENGGVATALNYGLKKMNGEYFSWLSHDDLYFPNKIASQVEYLSHCKNKNIILFSNYILIDEFNRQIGEPVIINHKMVTKKQEYCLLRGSVNGITMLIPKEAFIQCGNFDVNLRCTQDYDLWAKMLKKYRFVHMKDILSQTRVHPLQDTNKNPLVITEGEVLWTNMIESVPDKRKIQLEGSIYNYYSKMANHLKYSPYQKTIEMCLQKCQETKPKESKIKSKNNILSKVNYSIENYGYIKTIKIIIKKVLRIK